MPSLTRLGDLCTGHSCYPSRPSIQGSPNVIANGRPVVRFGDMYTSHCYVCFLCLFSHYGNLARGSSTVFVNGRQAGRIGDPLNCGSRVGQGSPNIFCGG